MIARARHSRGLVRPTSRISFARIGVIAAVGACTCFATPATAEVGAAVSIFSDGRFRGYSISDGEPVAILDLSYDDPGGAYVAASGSVVAGSGGLRPLALQLNGGYARRLSTGITLDAGIVHAEYSRYSSTYPGSSYTEAYAGAAWKYVSARIHLSPHYFEAGRWTLYGELDGNVDLAPKLNLNGHVGMLVPIRTPYGSENDREYDWRIGLSRQFERVSVHGAWTGNGRAGRYSSDHRHGGDAIVVGISCAL